MVAELVTVYCTSCVSHGAKMVTFDFVSQQPHTVLEPETSDRAS
jgi:hypothetical protein